MPHPATTLEQRLHKTKAQLIDEIDTLEQRAAAIEATYKSVAPPSAATGHCQPPIQAFLEYHWKEISSCRLASLTSPHLESEIQSRGNPKKIPSDQRML
jgi:hypothetical protein